MAVENEIYVLNKRLKLAHLPNGFKTGLDSVLLAAACPAQTGQSLLDLGCGVGGAGLSVLSRVERVRLTGIDIQQAVIDLARRNAFTNQFQDQCDFQTCDVRAFEEENAFDHVICNPPYLESGAHLHSPHPEKAKAMGHDDKALTLKNWIDTAHQALRSNGSLTLIHRAAELDDIIRALGKRFGAVEIIPLWPKAGVPAKRVIVRAIKHRKTPASLYAGLALHYETGDYTYEAQNILRHMAPLYEKEY